VLQSLSLSDDSDVVYLIPGLVFVFLSWFLSCPLNFDTRSIDSPDIDPTIDLNVLLQQMDVFENDAVMNVIILQSVLDELRTQNMRTYARLRQVIADTTKRFFVFCNQHHKDTYVELLPGETQKAYVERTIRVSARWYAMHFGSSSSKRLRRRRPLVVTNNEASLAPYVAEGIDAKTS
jgi:exosome complex exonuclease DIS3/RRP44